MNRKPNDMPNLKKSQLAVSEKFCDLDVYWKRMFSLLLTTHTGEIFNTKAQYTYLERQCILTVQIWKREEREFI